jgi:GTP-binding protein EngB required for normal cell division
MMLNDLQGKFNLLSLLLAAKADDDENLNKFQHLMDEDYINYTKVDNALLEEAEALLELQDIRNNLETFIHCKDIYSKNVIALAGGFSSGKSTFCNHIFSTKEIQLPISMDPETAIPAYIISGDKAPNAFGLTASGGSVELGVNSYKQMNHAFLKSFDFNLKDLLPSVVIHAEMPKEFEHICFIDTPGYNSSSTDDSFTKEDYDTSLMFIKQAKILFWFFVVKDGTISGSDLKFIEKIRDAIPTQKIVFICNKADVIPDADIENILDECKKDLDENEIPYEGIVAYSAKKRKEYGFRKKSLDKIISELNCLNIDKKEELQKRLKKLFRKHVIADSNRVQSLVEKFKALNQIQLHFKSLMDDAASKFNQEKVNAKFKDILNGYNGDSQKDEHLDSESIKLISNNISKLKKDLEESIGKYRKNKETISEIATKMDNLVKEIFREFGDSADDAYVRVPQGEFLMGSDDGPRDSRPAHSVKLDSFKMKMTLVTQAEWKKIMGDVNPAKMKGDALPICNVSFSQVTKYCNKLSLKENLKPCYDDRGNCNYDANGYRLPTEAEWEYAAQSFATLPLKSCAWYKDNSDDRIQPVAQKEENALGLFDMLGNVYEWVNDYWDDYDSSAQTNPHGPARGNERVIRGGSYKSNEKSCMVTARNMAEDDEVMMPIGFRVVKKG